MCSACAIIKKRWRDFEDTEYKLDHWIKVAKGEYNHICEKCGNVMCDSEDRG